MQNGDMLIFFLRSFRKVRFRKMQFLKDGVQTVVVYLGGYILKCILHVVTTQCWVEIQSLKMEATS